MNAFSSTADWLFAGIPLRYPTLKIVMSESGIGFLPMLYDRLEYTTTYFYKDNDGGLNTTWAGSEITPLEVLRRNFWFTCYWDPHAFKQLTTIGADRVMFEVDFPHADSTWPDSQDAIGLQIGAFAPDVIAALLRDNASLVYRHTVPDVSVLGQSP